MFNFTNLNPDGYYIAYLRKSRSDISMENKKKIDTLKQHEKFIIERAKQLNIKISKWYKEVVSGDTIQDRPEIKKLLKDVETNSVDGILVVDVDRLARGDTTDQGIISRTFKYTDTKIITLMKVYDPNNDEDEDFFEFNLFMARKEYKAINKRQQRGRISNVLSGKFCGSQPPYGYDKVKIKNDKGFTLQPNEYANIIKTIFEKRKNGVGINIICNYLNDLDIKPLKSDVWTPATIRTLLSNPVYIGKIRWNESKTTKTIKNGMIIKKRIRQQNDKIILVEGLHPAIIDEKTFKLVNNVKNCTSVRYDKSLQNPLAGIIKCNECGRNMVRRPYGTITKQTHIDTLICPKSHCKTVSSHLYLVENELLNLIKKHIQKETFTIDKLNTKNESLKNDIEKDIIKKKIESLNKQLEKAYNYVEKEIYSPQEFLNRSTKIKKEIEQQNNKLNSLPEKKDVENTISMIAIAQKIIDNYDKIESVEEKNELLKSIIDCAIYIKITGGRKALDRFTLDVKFKF